MKKAEAFTTMITPYLSNGEVDYGNVEKYTEWYFLKGLDGIFAVCQSSEIFYLSVEERVKINNTVWKKVKEIEKSYNTKMNVVSSGHVSDSPDDQLYELQKIAESGTDALILITNRFDLNNEGDDVWLRNAEKIISKLPDNIKLGLYECPMPYKRLVTPRILKWCMDTGRFYYMKDTCCDSAVLRQRCELLKGSGFKLLNANCQTLLSSLRSGGDGYCGIMCNFHPELYAWMCKNFDKEPEKAELLQSLIGTVGFTEIGLPYPLTAKYHMCLEGIRTENSARNRKSEELTDYVKECTEQMRYLCDKFGKQILSLS